MKACSRSWSTIALLLVIFVTIIALVSTSARAARLSVANAAPQMATDSGWLGWKYSVFGAYIGNSRISVSDIDGDGVLEMVMGADSGSGLWANDFWYVVKTTGADAYEIVWSSNLYSTMIKRIAVADVDVDGISDIYVGLEDGHVFRYDGLSMQQTGEFTAGGQIMSLVVADADGDGEQEIVISDGSKIYVYSALSLALEWKSSAYGGTDLAVGNVDADPAPEIVTTIYELHGYVLDGVSHVLEWDLTTSFGSKIKLGDVDSDGMAEIIGGLNSGKITVLDADIKSSKYEIPVFDGMSALLVADTDGAGAPEILYSNFQAGGGGIRCYDSVTQAERWFISSPEYYASDLAVGDVNNDGISEVLWASRHLHIADTLAHSIEWSSFDITGPLTSVDAGDVDDDGQTEIVMVSDGSNGDRGDGAIHIFDATTHVLEWRSTDLPDIVTRGVNSVKIGDVDDDGQTEFVIATVHAYNGLIQIYDGQTRTLERQSLGYEGTSIAALAIGDVDNDAKNEIVIGQGREHPSAAGVYLIVFDGATVTEEWKIGLNTPWGKFYDIELADVDNDNHIEILASDAGVGVYAYDGVTHQLDWSAAMQANALEVNNVDDDIQKEILVGKYDGVVDVYDGITHALENSFTLGNGKILGLLVDDVDQDGSNEWVVSESAQLYAFRGDSKWLVWHNNKLGSLLGNYNHLISLDVDGDLNKELVFGSNYALYHFTPVAPDHYTYLPNIDYNLCGLFDDFSDPNSGWPISNDGQFSYYYYNDEYHIRVGPSNSWAAARSGERHTNYTVGVDVHSPDYVINGSWGLVFDLSDNWQQFYTFEIDWYGYYYLWRYNQGDWDLLAYRYAPFDVHAGDNTNQLRVVRTGAQIEVFANDHLLVNTTDELFTGWSHTGLIVTSFDQPDVHPRFDNFFMYPPGCTVASPQAARMTSPDSFILPSPLNFRSIKNGENASKTLRPLQLSPQPTGR